MTFFDKKEEVMKIELTPYGRYLLSIGKLKPHSYRFFDENVIYNSESGGFNEDQNEAHVRITNNTPILKCNPNITGVETNVRKFDSDNINIDSLRIPTSDDTLSTNNESIGSCAHHTKDAPYFEVDMFMSTFIPGEMTETLTTNSVANAPIPQLPVNFYLSGSIMNNLIDPKDDVPEFGEDLLNEYLATEVFEDDTYIKLNWQNPMIRIKELNSFDEKENFVLTAYKVENKNNTLVYTRLTVPNRKKRIVNNILLDENYQEFGINAGYGLDDPRPGDTSQPNSISYFLDFLFDREIPDELICDSIGELKIKNIFLDERVRCPDVDVDEDLDIYSSRVTEDDLEDC